MKVYDLKTAFAATVGGYPILWIERRRAVGQFRPNEDSKES